MKKVLTLMIAFLISLGGIAQNKILQRNFFGFSLLDTKQKVVTTLKQKSFGFTQKKQGDLEFVIMNPVDFGGIHWNEVELTFHDNRLFSVRFFKPKNNHTQAELNKLALDFINKYGRDMIDISTYWNDPNRVTSLEGKDSYNTRIVMNAYWDGLALKYYDQGAAYSSTHPGTGDI